MIMRPNLRRKQKPTAMQSTTTMQMRWAVGSQYDGLVDGDLTDIQQQRHFDEIGGDGDASQEECDEPMEPLPDNIMRLTIEERMRQS